MTTRKRKKVVVMTDLVHVDIPGFVKWMCFATIQCRICPMNDLVTLN